VGEETCRDYINGSFFGDVPGKVRERFRSLDNQITKMAEAKILLINRQQVRRDERDLEEAGPATTMGYKRFSENLIRKFYETAKCDLAR